VKRAGLLVLGVWTGIVGMLVHRQAFTTGDLTWPWGLLAVVAVTWAVARSAGQVQRVGAAWFALGWAAVVLLEQVLGGDSYLVATDWVGWAFMLGCLGVTALEVLRASRLNT